MKKRKSDDVLKEYWSAKHRFADLFNGVLFDGKQVITKEDLQDSDTALATTMKVKDGEVYSLTRYADVVKIVKNKMVFAILGVENQDHIHYAMPVRVMLNHSLGYVRQCKEIRTGHQLEGTVAFDNSDEFLSGMKKTDRILPIVTLVIYYGEKDWDGPIRLHDMMDMPKEFTNFVSDYRLNLIQAREVEEEGVFHTEVSKFFDIMKALKNKETLTNYMNTHTEEIVDVETLWASAVAANAPELVKKMKEKSKGEVVDMCTALEELMEERKMEGKAEGKAEGVISICRDFGLTEEETVNRLVDKFHINVEKAWEYMQEFNAHPNR